MDSIKGKKICFLADKHDLYDDRIYWKMAVPLHNQGMKVYFYLIGDRQESGITNEGIHYKIWKLKTFASNLYLNFILKRLNPQNNYSQIFKAASLLKADIYHFHDLWINRIGPKLKTLPHGPVVFYDAREPYAEDYRSKFDTNFISKPILNIFSQFVDAWEKRRAKRYDMVIANEEGVRDAFRHVLGNDRAQVIFNYYNNQDKLGLVEYSTQSASNKKIYDFIYCGLLTEDRGAYCILNAIQEAQLVKPDLKVLVLGRLDPPELKENLLNYIHSNGLEKAIEFKYQVPFPEVENYYRQSRIGLILWQPVNNLKLKMPIKLFEYMSFGLPVIGSNMGHIARYLEKEQCGILVDPNNPAEVAEGMLSLLADQKRYKLMSENGRQAATDKYVWKKEFDRLLSYYKTALDGR